MTWQDQLAYSYGLWESDMQAHKHPIPGEFYTYLKYYCEFIAKLHEVKEPTDMGAPDD